MPEDVPYIRIGAMWTTTVNGKECYSVKINNPPLGWDGSALAMPCLPAVPIKTKAPLQSGLFLVTTYCNASAFGSIDTSPDVDLPYAKPSPVQRAYEDGIQRSCCHVYNSRHR